MAVSQKGAGFILYLEPQTLLNRVYYDSFLKKEADNATAFVAAKDIANLVDKNPSGPKPMLEPMRDDTLFSLLRSATNPNGVEIYLNAKISREAASPKHLVGYQTFVESDNIARLHDLSTFFRGFGFNGIADTPASIITHGSVMTYQSGGEVYKAIYMPPITERLPAERFDIVLARAEERESRGEELDIKVTDGMSRKGLKALVEESRRMLKSPLAKDITSVMDGTHRATSASIAGAELRVIHVEGSTKTAPSIPIRISDVAFAREKPRKREDRFLGLDTDGWTSLKDIGVDG